MLKFDFSFSHNKVGKTEPEISVLSKVDRAGDSGPLQPAELQNRGSVYEKNEAQSESPSRHQSVDLTRPMSPTALKRHRSRASKLSRFANNTMHKQVGSDALASTEEGPADSKGKADTGSKRSLDVMASPQHEPKDDAEVSESTSNLGEDVLRPVTTMNAIPEEVIAAPQPPEDSKPEQLEVTQAIDNFDKIGLNAKRFLKLQQAGPDGSDQHSRSSLDTSSISEPSDSLDN